MCTGAILLYNIPRVVIGENTTFKGNEDLLKSRGVEVIVINSAECRELMERFIKEKPEVRCADCLLSASTVANANICQDWYEDIGEPAAN